MPTTTTTATVILTQEVADLAGLEATIKAFNDAKAMIKHFEGLKAQAEAALREAMGTAKVGMIDGMERVTISDRTRAGVNLKDLQEAFPEAYELTRTETAYTVLTTK